jgi:hypothetical protein
MTALPQDATFATWRAELVAKIEAAEAGLAIMIGDLAKTEADLVASPAARWVTLRERLTAVTARDDQLFPSGIAGFLRDKLSEMEREAQRLTGSVHHQRGTIENARRQIDDWRLAVRQLDRADPPTDNVVPLPPRSAVA